MRLHTLLLSSSALLFLIGGEALAQKGDDGQAVSPDMIKAKRAAQGEAEKSDMSEEEMAEKRANSGPRVRHHDLSYCRFTVGFKPGRIPPGEMGALTVTAALGRSAVMSSPPSFSISSPKRQTIFTFGDPVFDPPPAVRHAPAFNGQLAYDDVVTFEVPFTVAIDAKHGQHRAGVAMKFELLDGESGNSLGLFSDSASTMVRVGDPIPSVLPSPTAVKPVEVANANDSTNPKAASVVAPLTGDAGGPVAGDVPEVAPQVRNEGDPADGPMTVGGDDGLPIVWIAGGGVLLLLLIMLLAKRK